MNRPIRQWAGQRVWLIGASSGIGEACAVQLMALGAKVACSARNAGALQRLVAQSEQALALPLDVCQHASLQAAAETLQTQWGGLDLVLIIAGGYNEMRADSLDLAVVNQIIDVNLRGVFNCLDVILPTLLRQGAGGVGIVSSVAGYGGLPKALVYGPTKAALINLTESLYLDLHPRGINVYQINPGFVDTPLTKGNDFAMPALMTATDAARAMLAGVARGEFHIHFPKRFTNCLRLARLLPYWAYFYLIRKVTGL